MFHRHVELFLHLIWTTRDRAPWLAPPLRTRVHGVIASVARTDRCGPVVVGGVEDHVHVLLHAPPTVVPSTLVGRLKGISSRFAHIELGVDPAFTWGDGYAIFSVDPAAVSRLVSYARAQEHHHAAGALGPAWEVPPLPRIIAPNA
jgi:REP element-mobilizing transposase RayT